ncbi:trichohyalin isoform X3 [Dunckerocampus dactyliophorus]|uniref:trichohyalin isoform X3 n=1 Tax=Dunckerocampus dactyliophorus TaxID=161453 RepID=UPI0024053ABB|nr:trichohyalin isoform X3 [Dunckerocampus dactyliophorus]
MAEHSSRDTDDLLQQDLHNSSSGFEQHHPPLRPDPCDFLLDAIDAQLGKLQVNTCNQDSSKSAPFKWSKDTGLGSTVSQTNDTPMSCLDLTDTPTVKQTSADGSTVAPVPCEEATPDSDVWTVSKVEMECHKEQVLWRLERLLGDTCKQRAMSGEHHLPSESICTEDFVRCFREEMVDLAMPEGSVQELDKEEEAERSMISDGDPCQSDQNVHGVVRFACRNVKSSKDTVDFCHYKPKQREERDRYPSHSSGVPTPHNVIYSTEIEREHRNPTHISSPKARCLAGVPVWNFDTVSIDSDLDSVCTDVVRRHLHRQAGAFQTKSTLLLQAQRGRRDIYRAECSLGNDDKDTDEESNGHWSRTSKLERASENMHSAWEKMRHHLSSLRQRCVKVEETLRMRKSHLAEVELSLSELQLRRKNAMQDLERLSAETGHMETEKRQLEYLLKDSKSERDSVSCQLQKLQRQKQAYLHDLRRMEEGLKKKDQLEDKSCVEKVLLNNISTCFLGTPHSFVFLFHKQTNIVMSELERQEMERQLDCAKTELFSEQRRAREKLESMQQMLEETCEELFRVSETETSLRNRCTCLEEKERQKKGLECQARELQGELGACKARVDTLEKMLAQKEQHLLDLQEQRGALQAEGDRQRGELEFIKTQHDNALKEARGHASSAMEAALKQQMKELDFSYKQQIKKVREDEAKMLENSLKHQKEESKKREEELHAETLEKVHKAVEEERRKMEAEKMESVHFHCSLLEEQNRRSLEHARSELHQEKDNVLTLQHKVAELQSRVQELEGERSGQQREQESLLSVICRSLKEEHQAELERLQKHMQQEAERTVLQLEQAAQLAKGEAEKIHQVLEEKEISHNEARAEQQQQLRAWAQELVAECEQLHLLMGQSGGKPKSLQLLSSATIDEAIIYLKSLKDPLKHLHQELDSLKQTSEQLHADKERELRLQRQQLRMERNQALDSLKERLIQEHIEELSSLKWAHMSDGGLEASLRRQLEAKDMELRQVQTNMAQWKEQTTARLACKFEEELTAELERKTSHIQETQRSEGQTRHSTKHQDVQYSNRSTCVYATVPHIPSDVASLKLVRYLQSRVNQLRVENQTWRPTPVKTGPCLLTVSQCIPSLKLVIALHTSYTACTSFFKFMSKHSCWMLVGVMIFVAFLIKQTRDNKRQQYYRM